MDNTTAAVGRYPAVRAATRTERTNEFAPVWYVFGLLLTGLAGLMAAPAIIDVVDGDGEWRAFAVSAVISLFFGAGLAFANHRPEVRVTPRQAFLLTAVAWVGLSAFGALPFVMIGLSPAAAFFETASGLTTTGSTVMVGLDEMPRGVLLWRSILQSLGGIGMIAMAVAVLPFLNIGGMQLFRTESSDRSDKVLPRASAITAAITLAYLGLTAICALLYWLGGMTAFEAICHALTTLSTGGYSTSDASLAHWDSAFVQWTATVFMFLGGLPFVLYVRAFQGHLSDVWRNSQVASFFKFLLVVGLVYWAVLWISLDMPFESALRHAFFNVVSVVTTTGYVSTDYGQWGGFCVAGFFLLTFVGGCTGSTGGAIKIFRFQIAWQMVLRHMRSLVYPHAIVPSRYDGKQVSEDVVRSVVIFVFTYIMTVALIGVVLMATGLDFLSGFSGAAQAVGNVGPGLGEVIGPVGNYSTVSDTAKWVLAAGMLLGRLEFFTLLVVLTPSFWRK